VNPTIKPAKAPATKAAFRALYLERLSVMPWWQDDTKRANFTAQVDALLDGSRPGGIDLTGPVLRAVWAELGLPKRPTAAAIAALPD